MKKHAMQMLIPTIIFVVCVSYLIMQPNGLSLDVDFKGGTQVVIESSQAFDTTTMSSVLEKYEVSISVARGIGGYSTMIDFDDNIDQAEVVSTLRENGFTFDKYSIQTVSPILSSSFFSQAIMVLIISFIFMSLVIFYIFKSPIISAYIAMSPAISIIETLAITQMMGIKLSMAGFAALIMIVGYSVDGDVIITTRALKRTDISMAERFKASFVTSLTMQTTTIIALAALLIFSVSGVITTIASYLIIGLLLDLLNTWLLNANLLRHYIEKKGVK